MVAAMSMAEQGYQVFLVEREKELGGRLRQIFYSGNGGDPQALLRELVKRVEEPSEDRSFKRLSGCGK